MVNIDCKTIASVTIDNNNIIRNKLDLNNLDENALRILHSILDQQRQDVLEHITSFQEVQEDSDEIF
jgi:hypothetical protein